MINAEQYRPYMTADVLMGPSSAHVLAELLNSHPLPLAAEDAVLDLGCGKGLTSLILARETCASIVANDLWISEQDNRARFTAWGVGSRIIPTREDANRLHFAKKQFAALVSVDAYHYFGTVPGFFAEKLLPFLSDGATVLIGVPGVRDEFAGRSGELLAAWLGDESFMFRSPSEWQAIIGSHPRIRSVETWQMDCFEDAWQEWFATQHQYALGDLRFFDTLIRPYTCFVGVCIHLN